MVRSWAAAGNAARNVLQRDDLFVFKDHGALNDVAQLAHVSRPVVVTESTGDFRRDAGDAPAQALAKRFDVVISQEQHIVTAFAQRWNIDLNY